MEKYLYLTKREWVDTWVNGGTIPIALASSYLSKDRRGTLTPDENRIHTSPVDMQKIPGFKIGDDAIVKGLTVSNSAIDGVSLPELRNAQFYREDGLILSFCNRADPEIARRLGKEACVKILSMERLKEALDPQVGSRSHMGPCAYTMDHQRNHFLKSVADMWQEEYRMFWPKGGNQTVILPKSIAVYLAIDI